MHWSILIAGIPERFHTVQPLLYKLLESQNVARMPDVEVLYLMDNKRRYVGAKRNDLMAAARGDYVSFIDDDDDVADEYVRKVYRAIRSARKAEKPPSVICFRQTATLLPHGVTHDCHYSLDYWKGREPDKRRVLEPSYDGDGNAVPGVFKWTGPPAHTMAWRRDVVAATLFPEQQFGEDTAWVDAACERATGEVQIDSEPLYLYRYNEATTSTRG